ncbi:hypothetical protein ccbrp13_67670 [Ktedonobacteria bacterium brp13]|nr:hypothetical protein ccbrp13_67670 [Ktedonobacteria bacterium brp13]
MKTRMDQAQFQHYCREQHFTAQTQDLLFVPEHGVILHQHAVFRDEEGTCPASFPAEKWAWRSSLKARLS